MPRQIHYYFTHQSPWVYLGHEAFIALAQSHGVVVVPKPMAILKLFAQTGGLPLAQRHPNRQAYRLVEMQRWRARRGLPLTLSPRYFPFNVSLADKMVIAAHAMGADWAQFTAHVLRGVWAEDANMADEAVLVATANRVGLDGAAVLARAGAEDVAEIYAANTVEAEGLGCFGAPGYVLDGELFWGQDRLDFLAEALASGRPPVTASAT